MDKKRNPGASKRGARLAREQFCANAPAQSGQDPVWSENALAVPSEVYTPPGSAQGDNWTFHRIQNNN